MTEHETEKTEEQKRRDNQWEVTRVRLLEKHGIDVEKWDNGEIELDV